MYVHHHFPAASSRIIYMMVEIRLLRYFVTVADTLHFARAAEMLHLAPQPLSQAIRRLEDQIGVQLFHRTSRKVELTLAGQAFYQRSRQMLTQLDEAVQLAQRVSKGTSGTLSVGYVPGAVAGVLPHLMQECQKHLPDVRLQLRELPVLQQLQHFHEGKLDLGIIQGVTLPSHFEHLPVLKDQLMAAVRDDHPLALFPAVPREVLCQQPLIGYDPASSPELLSFLDEVAPAGLFSGPPVQQVVNEQTALSLAWAGMGVAVVSRCQQRTAPPGMRFLPLLPEAHTTYQLVWQTSNNPALFALLERVRMHLEGQQSGVEPSTDPSSQET